VPKASAANAAYRREPILEPEWKMLTKKPQPGLNPTENVPGMPIRSRCNYEPRKLRHVSSANQTAPARLLLSCGEFVPWSRFMWRWSTKWCADMDLNATHVNSFPDLSAGGRHVGYNQFERWSQRTITL